VLIGLPGSFNIWHGHVHAARAIFQVIFVDFDKVNSKKAEDQIVALNETRRKRYPVCIEGCGLRLPKGEDGKMSVEIIDKAA
jgi:hypothetical protein